MDGFVMMPVPEKENDLQVLCAVTFQAHDKLGKWNIGVCPVWVDCPGDAIGRAEKYIMDAMFDYGWDDYWICGTNIVPELH